MREKIDPQKPLAVLRIRDVEGGEAGAKWSVAEWSTGAKRTPEQARPRAKRGGTPKKS